MLEQYITETQQLVNDLQGQMFPLPTITGYINRSRRRIAAMSQCIRAIPPGTQTIPRQEVYPFSDWKALVQGIQPGADSILHCRSLSVAIGGKWGMNNQIQGGGWKPQWRKIPFTDFQARFRIYNQTFFGTISEPGWFAQFGEGPEGKLYLAPIPAQHQPMEVDLTLIPKPLLTDEDLEPIPYPWTDAVCYFAAVLCLMQQQRAQDAKAMMDMFNTDLPMCAAVVMPVMHQSSYTPGFMRSA